MIELASTGLPASARWFPGGAPGVAALPEHVIATGGGRWWADRAVDPKAVAVSSGGHVLPAEDAPAVAALGHGVAWIHRSWGGPEQLASSGHCWGAFHRGRALSLACTYFLGSRYEDVAALADPGHRRQHLALACVTALCRDIAARGRTPSWTCSRDNRPSRLLAWSAGFRLAREYVHYATGPARSPEFRRAAAA
ncbi:GNAT family N-acetyltransferase [Streptomyces sp. NBC_00158]|uniref:GNAT family N-acetyltransferase n=1 Tax=Streptomyces sp. NBC_00158 TaxID=2903627 RepID=UPI00324CB828